MGTPRRSDDRGEAERRPHNDGARSNNLRHKRGRHLTRQATGAQPTAGRRNGRREVAKQLGPHNPGARGKGKAVALHEGEGSPGHGNQAPQAAAWVANLVVATGSQTTPMTP